MPTPSSELAILTNPISLGITKAQTAIISSGTRIEEISKTENSHERSLGSNPECENLWIRIDVSGIAEVNARTSTSDHLASIQSNGP
jgi:hypothetical protein